MWSIFRHWQISHVEDLWMSKYWQPLVTACCSVWKGKERTYLEEKKIWKSDYCFSSWRRWISGYTAMHHSCLIEQGRKSKKKSAIIIQLIFGYQYITENVFHVCHPLRSWQTEKEIGTSIEKFGNAHYAPQASEFRISYLHNLPHLSIWRNLG